MKKLTKKEIFTIPNIICYVRILLIPVICVLFFRAETRRDELIVAGVILLSSLSDMFDGMIARKFHQVTELGKMLDPVADKLTHAALAVCLATRYPLLWALFALMLVKEGYMGIMGLIYLKKGRMLNGAMWFGKICTALLFIGLMLLLVLPELPHAVVNGFILVMMAVMLFTLIRYIGIYRRMRHEVCAEEVQGGC